MSPLIDALKDMSSDLALKKGVSEKELQDRLEAVANEYDMVFGTPHFTLGVTLCTFGVPILVSIGLDPLR